jgi:hypothetical protein
MKNVFIKTLCFVILASVLLSVPVITRAYTDVWTFDNDHNIMRAGIWNIRSSQGVDILMNGFSNDDTRLEHEVKCASISIQGGILSDTKIKRFGYAYDSDSQTVMESEKIQTNEFDQIMSGYAEGAKFDISVPVYSGGHTVHALVEFATGEICEFWRISYTGAKETPEYPVTQMINVWFSFDGVDGDLEISVPAYIEEDAFVIVAEDVIAEAEKYFGKEYGCYSVTVNREKADFYDLEGGTYPKNYIVVSRDYDDWYEIVLKYEEVSEIKVYPNYEGAEGYETVKAVHNADIMLLGGAFAREGKFITDWNTYPDGRALSLYKNGYIAFPDREPVNVDIKGMKLYAIWADLGEPGDINGDKEVDNKDVVVLFKKVSGSDIDCVELALDVNDDGNADNKDIVTLFRYVSGGNVKAYYSGYATKYRLDRFRFNVPQGFFAATDEEDSLTLFCGSGDIITAVTMASPGDFSDVPDGIFAEAVSSGLEAEVLNVTRTEINGADAVVVDFVADESVCGKAAFVAKGETMLFLTYYDYSEFYSQQLNDAVYSIK